MVAGKECFVRAGACVVVSAALLWVTILSGSQAPAATVAPNGASADPSQEIRQTLLLEIAFHADDPYDPFIQPIDVPATEATSRTRSITSIDLSNSQSTDPATHSPAIALPPAVSSGLGLLGLLAGCMMLRRFAYRPAQTKSAYFFHR